MPKPKCENCEEEDAVSGESLCWRCDEQEKEELRREYRRNNPGEFCNECGCHWSDCNCSASVTEDLES